MTTMSQKKTRNLLHKLAVPLEIKSLDDAGLIEGYASVFGVRDSYDDVVVPGAFQGSLAEHAKAGTLPAMLWQHDPSEPIGVWTEMKEDGRGLYVKGQLLLDIDTGKRALALLRAGAIRGLSIGYRTLEDKWDEDRTVRALLKIDLWEVSIVTFPANRSANVTNVKDAIASIETEKDAEVILREAGFSRSEACGLVARIKAVQAQREAAAGMRDLKAGFDRLIQLMKN